MQLQLGRCAQVLYYESRKVASLPSSTFKYIGHPWQITCGGYSHTFANASRIQMICSTTTSIIPRNVKSNFRGQPQALGKKLAQLENRTHACRHCVEIMPSSKSTQGFQKGPNSHGSATRSTNRSGLHRVVKFYWSVHRVLWL